MARSISDSQCLIFKPRCLQSRHLILKNNLITEKRPLLFLSAITMTLRFKRYTGIVTVLASPGLIHLPLFYHHFLICNGKITGFFDSGRCRDKFSGNNYVIRKLPATFFSEKQRRSISWMKFHSILNKTRINKFKLTPIGLVWREIILNSIPFYRYFTI